jgi:hypothetical protein
MGSIKLEDQFHDFSDDHLLGHNDVEKEVDI